MPDWEIENRRAAFRTFVREVEYLNELLRAGCSWAPTEKVENCLLAYLQERIISSQIPSCRFWIIRNLVGSVVWVSSYWWSGASIGKQRQNYPSGMFWSFRCRCLNEALKNILGAAQGVVGGTVWTTLFSVRLCDLSGHWERGGWMCVCACVRACMCACVCVYRHSELPLTSYLNFLLKPFHISVMGKSRTKAGIGQCLLLQPGIKSLYQLIHPPHSV